MRVSSPDSSRDRRSSTIIGRASQVVRRTPFLVRLLMDDSQVLSQVTISTPCPMDWNRMSGGDRVRYCTACGKPVHDFARMTSAEASSLLRDHDGELCGRLSRLGDGTLVTADCGVAA